MGLGGLKERCAALRCAAAVTRALQAPSPCGAVRYGQLMLSHPCTRAARSTAWCRRHGMAGSPRGEVHAAACTQRQHCACGHRQRAQAAPIGGGFTGQPARAAGARTPGRGGRTAHGVDLRCRRLTNSIGVLQQRARHVLMQRVLQAASWPRCLICPGPAPPVPDSRGHVLRGMRQVQWARRALRLACLAAATATARQVQHLLASTS